MGGWQRTPPSHSGCDRAPTRGPGGTPGPPCSIACAGSCRRPAHRHICGARTGGMAKPRSVFSMRPRTLSRTSRRTPHGDRAAPLRSGATSSTSQNRTVHPSRLAVSKMTRGLTEGRPRIWHTVGRVERPILGAASTRPPRRCSRTTTDAPSSCRRGHPPGAGRSPRERSAPPALRRAAPRPFHRGPLWWPDPR